MVNTIFKLGGAIASSAIVSHSLTFMCYPTSSMLVNHFAANDPDIKYPCDGNPVGLTDQRKHLILPTRFSRIDYVGHGLFVAWSITATDRFKYGNERYLFNNDGVQLPVKAPAGCILMQVFWLGKEADNNRDLLVSELPDEALFRVSKGGNFGLCDSNGAIVLPPEYGFIGKAIDGFALIKEKRASQTGRTYVFDCRQRQITEVKLVNPDYMSGMYFSEGLAVMYSYSSMLAPQGYMDQTGEIVLPPRYLKAGPFIKGLAAVSTTGKSEFCINRQGKKISPESLDVEQFYGDFAIARKIADTPLKYGIVNRDYKFIMEPQFELLKPLVQLDFESSMDSPARVFGQTPNFFLASDSKSKNQSVITINGEVIARVPDVYFVRSLDSSGLLRCWALNHDARRMSDEVLINFEGNVIGDPFEDNSGVQHFSFKPIAPNRLAKTVKLNDGKFDPECWKSHSQEILSRRQLFGRFLEEHDLIGMSEQEVLSYFGPDGLSQPYRTRFQYSLQATCPPQDTPWLIFNLVDGKV